MRQRIDLEKVWRKAVRRAVASLDRHGEPVVTLPEARPFSLDDLLDEAAQPEDLAARLTAALPPAA